MLREYIISEAMAALGIPTTRSLAVVTTGEPVYRIVPQRGAVLTRVAASHLRVGTFEYAAALQDEAALRALADYAIDRHYPDLADAPESTWTSSARSPTARPSLIARWQLVGFIHGVMNTDNMAISGETIDYGPCAFMNAYDPATVYSSIDRAGRYAYGNQPAIAQWNLARLRGGHPPAAPRGAGAGGRRWPRKSSTSSRPFTNGTGWPGCGQKLGLTTAEDSDRELVQALLDWMLKTKADFTNTFRAVSGAPPTGDRYQDAEFRSWYGRWQERLEREGQPKETAYAQMRTVNPAVIPRNHRVEEALAAAEERDDLSVFQELLDALAAPYEDRPGLDKYREPPADETGYRTFCGT